MQLVACLGHLVQLPIMSSMARGGQWWNVCLVAGWLFLGMWALGAQHFILFVPNLSTLLSGSGF